MLDAKHSLVDEFLAPRFDFSALPRLAEEMAPMLSMIRAALPQAEIYFHYGETTGIVSFEAEVMGAASKCTRLDLCRCWCLGL